MVVSASILVEPCANEPDLEAKRERRAVVYEPWEHGLASDWFDEGATLLCAPCAKARRAEDARQARLKRLPPWARAYLESHGITDWQPGARHAAGGAGGCGRMRPRVIVSVFPGIDALGYAFEQEMPEACLLRGPDPIFGGDIRGWHLPPGVAWGIVGGPPCQVFSQLRHLNPLAGQKHGNLIPEFERVVGEGQPDWFVMENVPAAPEPTVAGYGVHSIVLNNRWLGEAQDRTRRFSFGTHDGKRLTVEVALFESIEYRQAVTSSLRAVPVALVRDGQGGHKVKRTYTEDGKRHGPSVGAREKLAEMLRYQGLPEDYLDESPFTDSGKRKAIGNAVPVAMGRAIARAVRRALGLPILSAEAVS
jgi:DNA (cytosine-5)-methyltransferase 1